MYIKIGKLLVFCRNEKTSVKQSMKCKVCLNLADLPPSIDIWCPRVELTLGQIYPLVEASGGQEWQFQISTVRAHIGRSTGRPTPHRGANSGTCRFLLLELILADQVAPADHLTLHLQI